MLYILLFIILYIIIIFNFSVNLFQFAYMLIKRGVVNAVNLDGGGSSLLMEGDPILNYPGDYWYLLTY